MNNKGQALVIFVIILPIIFLLIYFVVSKVYLEGEKKNQEDILEILCDYSKKNVTDNDIIKLGLENDKDLEIRIKRNNNIEITLEKKIKLFDKKVISKTICR